MNGLLNISLQRSSHSSLLMASYMFTYNAVARCSQFDDLPCSTALILLPSQKSRSFTTRSYVHIQLLNEPPALQSPAEPASSLCPPPHFAMEPSLQAPSALLEPCQMAISLTFFFNWSICDANSPALFVVILAAITGLAKPHARPSASLLGT